MKQKQRCDARQSGTAGKGGYEAYEMVTRSSINRRVPHAT